MNNVILLVSCLTILLGTLYPLLSDALNLGKVSVGRQYFDPVFIALMFPLLALLGVGPLLRWKRDKLIRIRKNIINPLMLSFFLAFSWIYFGYKNFEIMAAIGLWLGLWGFFSMGFAIKEKLTPQLNWNHTPRGFWGMMLGHIGLSIFVIGATLTSTYSTEKDIRLSPGENYSLGEYNFLFNGVKEVKGPNYMAFRGHLIATKNGVFVANLYPEKRTYQVQKMPMTEAAIDGGLFRDLFVAIGEDLGGGSWSLRIYHKPFIRWLWLGTIIMSFGALLAATDRRYRLMTKEGVRNIDGYNAKHKLPMPYIVVVVDEMSDLMLVAGKEIENYIQKLSQMARAAGIHIIMATQRPSVDVITGTIKANFPTRISFQVTSKIDSRTILGEQGAEQLLGKGDMLYMSSANRVIRIHAPFVSDNEIENINNSLRSQAEPDYVDEILNFADEKEMGDGSKNIGDKDELYQTAVEIIKSEGKASTSFLQRKLQIGYNRAARIIDMMEEEGIVSKANHVGKRDVL